MSLGKHQSKHDHVAAWVERALGACLAVWSRMGRRYARRMSSLDRLGDPLEIVATLAARRAVPLRQRSDGNGEGAAPGHALRRALPHGTLAPLEHAFNSLESADRYALSRLDLLGPGRGARGEHLASALGRLVEAEIEDRPPP